MKGKSAFFSVRALVALVLLCGAWTAGSAAPGERLRKQLFDEDWRFCLGDDAEAQRADFDDAGWRTLDLPHDWSIAGFFDRQAPTGNDGGYLPAGIGWYRKAFTVAPDEGARRMGLYFEGVYMNAEVFVNGQSVGSGLTGIPLSIMTLRPICARPASGTWWPCGWTTRSRKLPVVFRFRQLSARVAGADGAVAHRPLGRGHNYP